jgi:hypothetical protein
MTAPTEVVSRISTVKANGKRAKTVDLCNALKVNRLLRVLKEDSGGWDVIGGGYILTVALCQGKRAGKMGWSLDFGAR